jgi:hypothetical protein
MMCRNCKRKTEDLTWCIRASGSDVSYWNSGGRTWTEHQAAGYDLNGVNKHPDFDTGDW